MVPSSPRRSSNPSTPGPRLPSPGRNPRPRRSRGCRDARTPAPLERTTRQPQPRPMRQAEVQHRVTTDSDPFRRGDRLVSLRAGQGRPRPRRNRTGVARPFRAARPHLRSPWTDSSCRGTRPLARDTAGTSPRPAGSDGGLSPSVAANQGGRPPGRPIRDPSEQRRSHRFSRAAALAPTFRNAEVLQPDKPPTQLNDDYLTLVQPTRYCTGAMRRRIRSAGIATFKGGACLFRASQH